MLLSHRGLSCIWMCLHLRGMCCSWRCLHQRGQSCICVCTTEACAASGGVCHRGLSCIWMCLHYRGMCCTGRCLQYTTGARATSEHVCTTEACATPVGVYTTRTWAASGRVCTEACDAPGDVCHRGLSWTWTCLHYRGMCCSWRCLHTGTELHLDVSNQQGPVPAYCRTCWLRFKNNLLTVGRVGFASKIIFYFI
jgi:hypothetical protein